MSMPLVLTITLGSATSAIYIGWTGDTGWNAAIWTITALVGSNLAIRLAEPERD